MTLGERIREIRRIRGLSQTELGNKIGLNADRIQKYENGARNPKAPVAKTIARALEVDERVLLRPNYDTPLGFIQILMDIEDDFGLKIKEKKGDISISFGDKRVNTRLKDWYNNRKLINDKNFKSLPEETQTMLEDDYHRYKVFYPTYELICSDRDEEINNLKEYIKMLEIRLNQLENDRDEKR